MNCETTQKAIKNCAYGSEVLKLDLAEQSHLNNCSVCQEFANNNALKNILEQVTHCNVPDGLEDRILEDVHEVTPTVNRNPFGFYAAAASIVFALVLIGSVFLQSTETSVSQINLLVNEVKPIKFMLTSNNALADANIRISLSDGIALAGFDNARQVSWKTDIKQGNNLLTLPVHLLQPVDGKIELLLEHDGSSKTYVIKVSANQAEATNSQNAVPI